MNETSLQAYWSEKLSHRFEVREAQVMDNLNIDGPATRKELARRTGLSLSSICGRVYSLIKEGFVEEYAKVPDPDTLKNVWAVRIKKGVLDVQ